MTGFPADCPVPDVRSEFMGLIQKMRGAITCGSYQRMHQLTGEMEMLARAYLEPVVIPLPGIKFTASEARIIARLAQGNGDLVTKQQLMDALYFDRPGDEPCLKIVDVFICKTRKKMGAAAFHIETIFGQGYALKPVHA